MRTRKIIAAISAASIIPLTVTISGAGAGEFFTAAAELTRKAAYLSAGVPLPDSEALLSGQAETEQTAESMPPESEKPSLPETEEIPPPDTLEFETLPPETAEAAETIETAEAVETAEAEEPQSSARVISQNITDFDDGLDYSAAGNSSGVISRRTYGLYTTGEYITLDSGAQVKNCTSDTNASLLAASKELPKLGIELNSPDPQVLIIHTHTTESYEPYERDYFDAEFPFRTRDSRHNMVAIGEELAQTLAENGISVLHDGTIHDYPAYTGAYDRSEETIRGILEEYPSIKVVIDLHRDAMTDADGSRIAPVKEVGGKSAAQFMIIAGCDDGRFNMPNYIENFKLAALIQNSSEVMFPGLARAVLFDYRNYNQHITTGSLLIEVGSHANSLDEALYTAELLGESMAAALTVISQ